MLSPTQSQKHSLDLKTQAQPQMMLMNLNSSKLQETQGSLLMPPPLMLKRCSTLIGEQAVPQPAALTSQANSLRAGQGFPALSKVRAAQTPLQDSMQPASCPTAGLRRAQ